MLPGLKQRAARVRTTSQTVFSEHNECFVLQNVDPTSVKGSADASPLFDRFQFGKIEVQEVGSTFGVEENTKRRLRLSLGALRRSAHASETD
jgi:hypothetical protein